MLRVLLGVLQRALVRAPAKTGGRTDVVQLQAAARACRARGSLQVVQLELAPN